MKILKGNFWKICVFMFLAQGLIVIYKLAGAEAYFDISFWHWVSGYFFGGGMLVIIQKITEWSEKRKKNVKNTPANQ